jgi:hypothetical protein
LERFEAVLNANCRLGLIPDNKGHTALRTALKSRQKQVVRMLLGTMLYEAGTFPAALEPFMRHRVELCSNYPDLFLEFTKMIELVDEDDVIPEGKNTVLLQDSAHILTVGSVGRALPSLWSHALDADTRQTESESNSGGNEEQPLMGARVSE